MAPRRTRRATRKNHRHPMATRQISRREEGSPDSTPDNLLSATATVVAISSDENHINILGDSSSGEADNTITNNYSSGCSTPKGKRYRIPEIQTCPPAPKKRRVVSNCALKRSSPVAFFAPPDVELFFFFALRGISVSN